MELFYLPGGADVDQRVAISGAEARHIVRVLRHRVGDEISGTDGQGNLFRLRLEETSASRVIGRIVNKKVDCREPKRFFALAPAVLKGDKLSPVVEAVTELGVSEVIPFMSKRVVGKMSETKIRRLTTVAISAMKSSTRTILPKISNVVDLFGLLDRFGDFDQVLLAYEEENQQSLDAVLSRNAKSLLLIIGPEGGFEGVEVERMKAAGAAVFTLGPRRLRAETAAVTALACCLGLLGELG